VPETLKHAIFDCPVAISAWSHFRNALGLNNDLTYEDVLFGLNSTLNQHYSTNQASTIDTLGILLKQQLILQRENKHVLELHQVSQLIKARLNLEIYNCKKYDKNQHFRRKWEW